MCLIDSTLLFMLVSCTYRIVENLIDHDRTCVKHRIIRPEAPKKYGQTDV